MSYYNTYNAIVSAVVEMAEDDSQEFMNFIPKSIELAQMRLEDELDLDSLNTPIELTCVPSSRLILKPTGYRFTNNIFIVTSGGNESPLKKVSTDYLRDYSANPNSTGQPLYYSTDYSNSYLMVAPTPASSYVLLADMRTDITYLSITNQQNFFTEYCGNALFFATMKEQASFMKNPSVRDEFEQKYLNSIQGINNRGRRDRRQDGGTASTTESGKNTLMGTK